MPALTIRACVAEVDSGPGTGHTMIRGACATTIRLERVPQPVEPSAQRDAQCIGQLNCGTQERGGCQALAIGRCIELAAAGICTQVVVRTTQHEAVVGG